ncbi:hypothetical protein PSYMO_20443, partial [Pseudomonas amygdali pv. mori str. 301020]
KYQTGSVNRSPFLFQPFDIRLVKILLGYTLVKSIPQSFTSSS